MQTHIILNDNNETAINLQVVASFCKSTTGNIIVIRFDDTNKTVDNSKYHTSRERDTDLKRLQEAWLSLNQSNQL